MNNIDKEKQKNKNKKIVVIGAITVVSTFIGYKLGYGVCNMRTTFGLCNICSVDPSLKTHLETAIELYNSKKK